MSDVIIYAAHHRPTEMVTILDYLANSRLTVCNYILDEVRRPFAFPTGKVATLVLLSEPQELIEPGIQRCIQKGAGAREGGLRLVVVPGFGYTEDYVAHLGDAIKLPVVQLTGVMSYLELAKRILDEKLRAEAGKGADAPLNVLAEELHASTIAAYSDPSYADKFYHKWKDDIPFQQLDELVKRLPRGARILDAGCGPGHHSHYLAGLGYEVLGVDLSQAALAIANDSHRGGARPFFRAADMRAIPVPSGTFDGVWAAASCVHTPNEFIREQFSEFERVLKPGGILGLTMQVGRLRALEEDGRFFEGHLDESSVNDRVEQAGLCLVHVSRDETLKNTRSLRHVVRWMATVARKSG